MNAQYFDNIKRQQQLQQEQQQNQKHQYLHQQQQNQKHQHLHQQQQQQQQQQQHHLIRQQQYNQQQQQPQHNQQHLPHHNQQQQPSQYNQQQQPPPHNQHYQIQQHDNHKLPQQYNRQHQLQQYQQQQPRKDIEYGQYPQKPVGSNMPLDSAAQSDLQLQTQSSAKKETSYRATICVNAHVNSTVQPSYSNSTQVATPAHSRAIAAKHQPDILLREAKHSSKQVPYNDYSIHDTMELKEKILQMDQENANLRNQLFDNSETILLLQATLQASDIECQNNVKTAIEQKDSEILFKDKQLASLQRDYQKLVKELTALKKVPSTQAPVPVAFKVENSNGSSSSSSSSLVVYGSSSSSAVVTDSVPIVRPPAAVVTAQASKERMQCSYSSPSLPYDEVDRAATERLVRKSVIILHQVVAEFEQLLACRELFQTDKGVRNSHTENSSPQVTAKSDHSASIDSILDSMSTILRESLLESRLLDVKTLQENLFLDGNFGRLLTLLTQLLQRLLAHTCESSTTDNIERAKKMNSARDLCLSMLTLVVDSPFLDRPSSQRGSSDFPQSKHGLNLIDKFDQAATSLSASKKPSANSSHSSAKRPRAPEEMLGSMSDEEDDEAWGFPLAAVTGLNLTPQPIAKSLLQRTNCKIANSSRKEALSLLAVSLQRAWVQWTVQTSSSESSTATLLAGLISRTCHRAMECGLFGEDGPLLELALSVLSLDHSGISKAERIALLIALDATFQRMRFPLSFFRCLQRGIALKKESATRTSGVKKKEIPGMVDDFESQFIFKLTSIVFDIGSSTELLRYQIQVVAFLLALLSARSDIVVAIMIGLPMKIVEDAAERGPSSTSSFSLTESAKKRSRPDGFNNQLFRSSSTKPQQPLSQAAVAIAKSLSQQVDASTPQPQDPMEEKEERGSRFDWSPYMLSTSSLPAHKGVLHGLCRRWIGLTRHMGGKVAAWNPADFSGDLLHSSSQAEQGHLQAILVVRIAELLNGIAGHLQVEHWTELMGDKRLDVNSFIVRWHINLHPSIRKRLPATSLHNISLF